MKQKLVYFVAYSSLYFSICSQLKGWRFRWKNKLSRKGLNLSMWASFCLRNIALTFFSLGCSFFSRINVCKKSLCFDKPSRSVFVLTCLLNRKQAKCLQCTKSKSNLRAYRSRGLGTDCLHRLLWRETQRANRSIVKRNTIKGKGDVMC